MFAFEKVMALHFLDFDYSEDAEGTASWDAIACVAQERLQQLLAEIQLLLGWAYREFGAVQGPLDEGGLWQYDLHSERLGHALETLHFDPETGRIAPVPEAGPEERLSLTLTISGAADFAEAFSDRFGLQP